MFQTNNIHSLIFFSNTDKRKAETEAEDFEFFDTEDDIIDSPSSSVYKSFTEKSNVDVVPPEKPSEKETMRQVPKAIPVPKTTPPKVTPKKSALKTKPTPASVKSDVSDISKMLGNTTLEDKMRTTSSYVAGVEGLLVVPMLLWIYRKDLQEYCKVQLHLPSGWTESEIQSYEITDTPRGENTRLIIEFIQLRGFHSVQRLTSNAKDTEKPMIREGPQYQAMKDHIQEILEHNESSVKVDRTHRLSYKVICDLPFPVEKKCRPEISSFDHDLQPEKMEQVFFDANDNEVDPYEDDWPCLEIFDVDLESLVKPTCLNSRAVRRTRVKGKLFDDTESP